jgi:hypothetical protein
MSAFIMRDTHRDLDTVSRATSVSRRSSTVSRAQTLIRKNIAPHDLRPSDVIIERFIAWKAIVKQLIGAFFNRQSTTHAMGGIWRVADEVS